MTKDLQPDKWPELPLLRNETVIEAPVDRDLLVKRCTEEVVEFLEQNQERPFFVYLPHTMPGSTSHPFSSAAFRGKSSNGAYGDAVRYRGGGASAAAKYGAVAVIVRSVTGAYDDNPHTGALNYNDSFPKIPAVAISTKDADMLSEYLKGKYAENDSIPELRSF